MPAVVRGRGRLRWSAGRHRSVGGAGAGFSGRRLFHAGHRGEETGCSWTTSTRCWPDPAARSELKVHGSSWRVSCPDRDWRRMLRAEAASKQEEFSGHHEPEIRTHERHHRCPAAAGPRWTRCRGVRQRAALRHSCWPSSTNLDSPRSRRRMELSGALPPAGIGGDLETSPARRTRPGPLRLFSGDCRSGEEGPAGCARCSQPVGNASSSRGSEVVVRSPLEQKAGKDGARRRVTRHRRPGGDGSGSSRLHQARAPCRKYAHRPACISSAGEPHGGERLEAGPRAALLFACCWRAEAPRPPPRR